MLARCNQFYYFKCIYIIFILLQKVTITDNYLQLNTCFASASSGRRLALGFESLFSRATLLGGRLTLGLTGLLGRATFLSGRPAFGS